MTSPNSSPTPLPLTVEIVGHDTLRLVATHTFALIHDRGHPAHTLVTSYLVRPTYGPFTARYELDTRLNPRPPQSRPTYAHRVAIYAGRLGNPRLLAETTRLDTPPPPNPEPSPVLTPRDRVSGLLHNYLSDAEEIEDLADDILALLTPDPTPARRIPTPNLEFTPSSDQVSRYLNLRGVHRVTGVGTSTPISVLRASAAEQLRAAHTVLTEETTR